MRARRPRKHSPPATHEHSRGCVPQRICAPVPRARSPPRGGGSSPLESEAAAGTAGAGTDSAEPWASRQRLCKRAANFSGGEGKRRSQAPTLEAPAGGQGLPTFPRSGQNQVFLLARYSTLPEKPAPDLGQGGRRLAINLGETAEEIATTCRTCIKNIVISQTSLNCQNVSHVDSQTLYANDIYGSADTY